VLRAVPHWFRLTHEFESPDFNPYVHLPEAVIQYRDRLGMPFDATDLLPAYGDRGRRITDYPSGLEIAPGYREGLRGERGIASIGELLLFGRAGKLGKIDGGGSIRYDTNALPSDIRDNILYNSSFQIDYASVPERAIFESDGGTLPLTSDPNYPYLFQLESPPSSGQYVPLSAQVSTDVMNPPDPAQVVLAGLPDDVWDATDPEAIVEENRYVMLVDRSEVNRPSDRPKILYLEQLPP
jgi:hypothetical protein